MRGVLRTAVPALTVVFALSACGGGAGTDDVLSSGGWPGRHSDARNSNTATAESVDDLAPGWTRPLGGPVGSPAGIAANGQVSVAAATEAGCNLFSFQMDTGRKRWCTRLAPAVTTITPVSDGVANIYVGEDGGLLSFNEHGQRRWRIPVSGSPRSAQFTSDGSLLVVTHFGQVNVVDPQTGQLEAPLFDLVPVPTLEDGQNLPRLASDHGLPACFGGSEDCPVATTPAVDTATDRVFVTVWRPGSDRSALVALRYTAGDDAVVIEEWSVPDLPGGAVTSPVLSADGSTVYVHDGEGALWALDAETGEARWTHETGRSTALGPAVTEDGLLLLASADGSAPLTALRDGGDSVEVEWERADVTPYGAPAVTADGRAYVVVDGDRGLAAAVLDLADGATMEEEPLDPATGLPVGTGVGPGGEFVITTLDGDVVVLREPQSV
ncbi:PQQ-binding-like beta-propeller repeat protein [Rhodococcus sp. LW-XY12]|uniref:outer membrane protein assembly factor BamB family protein n=1 Tax=Rhodococcus sp. LW-XY12 TaxID=2856851 RepID=UPI001C56DE17|nr:PQQ-binding-like beta-propeller repeat protein [Rhodococcus sp. LW-XY12]QXU52299.1 PQQ-binding-like beta-propeller repeat protein [Rhodococcus sp. LW-XY12]